MWLMGKLTSLPLNYHGWWHSPFNILGISWLFSFSFPFSGLFHLCNYLELLVPTLTVFWCFFFSTSCVRKALLLWCFFILASSKKKKYRFFFWNIFFDQAKMKLILQQMTHFAQNMQNRITKKEYNVKSLMHK